MSLPSDKTADHAARYVNYIQIKSFGGAFSTLSSFERQILDALGLTWSRGERVTVAQARDLLSPVMSSATAQRKITGLRRSGFIQMAVCISDGRVKYVEPTALLLDYFEHQGRCVVLANGISDGNELTRALRSLARIPDP